jgi:ubiquitin carboxyl-terminal hydrolase 5/13
MSALEPFLSQIRVPTASDRVYKEECAYTFDTPYSPAGLFTNLKTFQAVGEEMLLLDSERSGCRVYFHQKWVKIPKDDAANNNNNNNNNEQESAKATPTKLAIGVEGGFDAGVAMFDVERTNSVVIFDEERVTIPYPSDELPMLVQNVVQEILSRDDAGKEHEFKSWEDEYQVSKYADSLIQLDTGVRISSNPDDWKCAHCDRRDNLWLNLSDGYIGGGRKNYDGSGGCGAALAHFQETGQLFPLCVKLGTITPQGADVYSYAVDEDDMVMSTQPFGCALVVTDTLEIDWFVGGVLQCRSSIPNLNNTLLSGIST